MKRLPLLVVILVTMVYPAKADETAADQTKLLRFPAIHKQQVVFTYAGDLYTVSVEGGTARRLTSDKGYEMFPRFSPDGRHIAFTAQYDGNTEVYRMPAAGGVPRRLTYTATLDRDDVSDRMGPNNIVMGWTPDGERIVYRSRRYSYNSFNGQLFTVNAKGGSSEELPLPRGGFCSYSPDGNKLAYNRIFREFRTWKRYRGGMADDVWIYDLTTRELVNITENPAQDIIPMWKGDKIFFLSDRGPDKRMNLYSYDLDSEKTKRLTNFSDFDIKFPSLGQEAIVFENGGSIYRYDTESHRADKIKIRIREDMAVGRGGIVEVSDQIRNFEVSRDGKRALFGARGDVFTVPAERGVTRNLTATPGTHERNAVWSPNGRWIAYISDATGEDEIYIEIQDGKRPPKQVTRNADTYKYALKWSPDSRKILWSDKRLRLRYVNVRTGRITEVDNAEAGEFHKYSWSPDSRWIVYTRPETEGMNRIYLYSLKSGQSHSITDGWYSVSNPEFSSDGRFVFFVSNRDFNPIYSSVEWNYAYRDMSRIYFVTLAKDVDSPFETVSDEVQVKKKKKAPKDSEEDTAEKKEASKQDKPEKKLMRVDIDGIQSRVDVLPIEVARYWNLTSVNDLLYYNRRANKDSRTLLMMYNLKDRKETEIGPYGSYEISADRKKMMIGANGGYAIIDLPKSKTGPGDKLDLSDMEVSLDRKAEWSQIFNECWRQMREFFYVPNMHGVDWEKVRETYEPLVKYVNHRADLTYIIGEMIGELNVGHTYVGGGDRPRADRIKMGLLGARLERHEESGFYRIAKILRGQNWDRTLRSPLTELGVDISEGDYILAVNGKSTAEVSNIYELLINTAGKQTTLTVNSKPAKKGARDELVVPIDDESGLYYFEWVQNNIEKVNRATDGKVGYLHVPDMGRYGLNEFVKYFYPQLRKKALIVDVRGNGGGNVSPMLIERLRREAAMITFARNTSPRPNPSELIYGPMVCLADEFSASDGDLFTYRFKHYKLGKVIGKRTWGGVVGIRGSLPLLDGGYLNKPEFSRYDLSGRKWIIEGIGVEPDIYVDNDPALEYEGVDQQLNKAVEVILKELDTKEKQIPPLPDYSVR